MRSRLRLLTILTLLLSCGVVPVAPAPAQATQSYAEVRALLSRLELENDRDGSLATLFQTGDGQVENLLRALDDPDNNVRDNAQVIIRYLGNPAGMDVLISRYAKSDELRIAGPVPLPLRQWDFDFVSSTYVNKPQNFGHHSTLYLYALALDGSPNARQLLHKMLETAKGVGTDAFTLKAVGAGDFNEAFDVDNEGGLAEAALRASKFLPPVSKKAGSARLIAFNQARDKALVRIHIDHGVLAERVYHVVLNRRERGWVLYSINPVSES